MTMWKQYRASQSIVSMPNYGKILIYNFLTQRAAVCTTDILYWINSLTHFQSLQEIADSHPGMDRTALQRELAKLEDRTIVIAKDSPEHEMETNYSREWEWGSIAGMYHFSLVNNVFMDPDKATQMLQARATQCPSPPLYWTHDDAAIPLSAPETSKIGDLLAVMRKRRTNRVSGDPSITLDQLSDVLYSGMAITGEVDTSIGRLPLQMTPAGGARNAFEAYVLARNVVGLDPGVYHYSATQHSLSQLGEELPEKTGELLAGQDWADDKPATIFLVGFLERPMWKYRDPNAYRVVLIEAGHKGQNIALAATAHELSACPTAALNHDLVSRYLKLDRITHTPIYALTLSKPGPYDFEILGIATGMTPGAR